MRTIAITNQKGGCGKTTTSVNLSAALAEKGQKVLALDLDPQGHTTLGFGLDPGAFDCTIYDCLANQRTLLSASIVPTGNCSVDLCPANIMLSGVEADLAQVSGKQMILREQLKLVNDEYDICIIDCPPSLGLLTLNGLIASTDFVVPVQANYYALEGLKQLLETVQIVRERFQPCHVRILGLLLTFVETRSVFCRQVESQTRDYFGDLVLDTVIHRAVRLAEAPSAGESVLTYAPKSRGANEYRMLAEELLSRLTRVKPQGPSEAKSDQPGRYQESAQQIAEDQADGVEPVQFCVERVSDGQTA